MEKIISFLNKYWVLLSIASSIATGGWWLYGKIDRLNDTVNNTNQWVQDHDDAIVQQHDDILVLKEDERLREKGLLK